MAKRWAHQSFLGIAAAMLLAAAQAAPYAYIPRPNGVSVIDVQTDSIVADVALPGTPHSIGARAGSRFVYVSNGTDKVWAIDTIAQAVVATLDVPQPQAVTIDPVSSSALVVTGCAPGPCPPSVETRITTLNSSAQTVGETRAFAGISATRLDFHPTGSRLFLMAGPQVRSVHPQDMTVFGSFTLPGNVGAVTSLANEAEAFYVAVDNGVVYYMPAGTPAPASPATVDVVVHPQGTRLYAANAGNDTVAVIDRATGFTLATVAVGSAPAAIDVSPSGDKVYVVNGGSNSVSIISTATNTVTKTIVLAAGTTVRGRFIGGVRAFDAPDVLTGLWWNPSQPGWGLHLTHRRNTIFAAWFTYDAQGERKWYVASACRMSPMLTCPSCVNNTSCDGDLFEVSGADFLRQSLGATRPAYAGGIRIDFRNRDNATFHYTLGTRSGTVPITRQLFQSSGTAGATDYTDLWWNPSESGWGLGITQQFGVMFLTWFVYDSAGRPVWYVASDCVVAAGGKSCSGKLYRTAGPAGPASGAPFDPAALRVTEVGTISVAFTDESNGIITYTVDGIAGSRAITRQTF